MNYQNETLPEGAVKAGSTPGMTEETVVPGILKKHHHVSITGKVRFRLEFYDAGGIDIADSLTKKGERPGEDFIET